MTVKQLITELLDLPMDSKVDIAFQNKDDDYAYQSINTIVMYDDNVVGLVGRNNSLTV